VYLDAYSSIAQRFTALITPSDVLNELKQQAATPRVVNMSVGQVAAPADNAYARCPACSTQGMS
jgi:pyridoxal biosynthesis lyase PdxS